MIDINAVFPDSKIRFVPDTHTYFVGDRQLASVSSIVKSLVPPFDRERISARSAAKKGVSQESLLAEWDKKAELAREKGTRVHAYIDDFLAGVQDPVLLAVNEKLPEMIAFEYAWNSICGRLDAKVVAKEKIVWSESLGVAGRMDLVLEVDHNGLNSREACIFDWKTGKFAVTNPYEKLLPPFQDIDNCELGVYSIQTSLYRLILEGGGVFVGPAYLCNLSEHGTFHLYRTIDLRERVGEWLKRKNQWT
jgi:hypothetical protein